MYSSLGARCLRVALLVLGIEYVRHPWGKSYCTSEQRLSVLSIPFCRVGSLLFSDFRDAIFYRYTLRSHARCDILHFPPHMQPRPRCWRALKHYMDPQTTCIYWPAVHSSSDYQAIR